MLEGSGKILFPFDCNDFERDLTVTLKRRYVDGRISPSVEINGVSSYIPLGVSADVDDSDV